MGGLSRRDKESRAFNSLVIGGGSAVAAVVFLVIGWTLIGLIALGVAAFSAFRFKTTVGK
jgi:hypothetical protein